MLEREEEVRIDEGYEESEERRRKASGRGLGWYQMEQQIY